MLKIKDNLDLKELEKFGFEQDFNPLDIRNATIYIDSDKIIHIVSIDNLWYDKDYYYNWNSDTDIIYDLIKADMVEKVEE